MPNAQFLMPIVAAIWLESSGCLLLFTSTDSFVPLSLQEYFLSQHQKVSRQQQERQAQQQERVQAKLQQRQEAFKAPEVSEQPMVDALL